MIIPKEVTFSFGRHDRTGNLEQATEWLNILISVVPTDPGVLARLGDIFSRENDKSRAFQYYSEVSSGFLAKYRPY